MKHQKHTKLTKPSAGFFGRREWAILGTPCGNIQQLAAALATRLQERFLLAYVDADHQQADAGDAGLPWSLAYTDKISFHRFDRRDKPTAWQQRAWFNEQDLVLINGNHFSGARQMVALDRRKFDSLQRKTDRLTQVDLFLTDNSDEHFARPDDLPEMLKQHLPNWADIPVLDRRDTGAIAAFLEAHCAAPPLAALVLAGGKSTRMGEDKAALDYHGIPQWQYLRDLLHGAGVPDVFVSCRAGQEKMFAPDPVIADTFLDLGPFGAILSAFRHNPNTAWLVVACDLPLLDGDTLRHLLDQRRPAAVATAFRQAPAPPGGTEAGSARDGGFPEPLITIWEPKSYLLLLQFLAQGISCPRKALINSDTQLLDAPRPEALLNANTPAEREQILQILQNALS